MNTPLRKYAIYHNNLLEKLQSTDIQNIKCRPILNCITKGFFHLYMYNLTFSHRMYIFACLT